MSYMNAHGTNSIKADTKKHIRHKLEAEFGKCLNIFLGNNNVLLVIHLTFEQLAIEYMIMKEKLDMYSLDDQRMKQS